MRCAEDRHADPGQAPDLLFSATMPKPIAIIASAYLTDPVEVAVAPVATTAEKIDQRVIFVSRRTKSRRCWPRS
jgi:ATP-dependent RNA helicase RhlE